MTLPRRTIGRRKTDRFRMAIGLGLGLVLLGLVLQLSRCNATRVSGPDPTPDTPQQAVSTPAPTPAATPAAAPPAEGAGLTASFGAGPTMSISNTHPIPMTVGYCNFRVLDGGEQQLHQSALDVQVASGGHYDPELVKLECQQIDAIFGGSNCQNFSNIIGAAYFKNGLKVSSSELKGCTPACVEKWTLEEVPEYGEWSACQPNAPSIFEGPTCSKHRSVTYYESNNCTKARRVARTATETVPCDCPCTERNPNGTKTYSLPVWGPNEQGACQLPAPHEVVGALAETLCHENGTQAWTIDYSCKADEQGTDQVCHSVPCPCVEPKVIPEIPGAFSWNNESLPGVCDKEVFPVINSPSPKKDCHRTGTQTFTRDFTCQQDTTFTVDLCENVECTGACYYNIDGDDAAAEEASCHNAGGIWLNFVQGALHNHCQFAVPGVSLCDFQLAPGQSDNSCLSKPKHGCNN